MHKTLHKLQGSFIIIHIISLYNKVDVYFVEETVRNYGKREIFSCIFE